MKRKKPIIPRPPITCAAEMRAFMEEKRRKRKLSFGARQVLFRMEQKQRQERQQDIERNVIRRHATEGAFNILSEIADATAKGAERVN